MIKKALSILLAFAVFLLLPYESVLAVESGITAKAYILIEKETGKVIFSKNENEQLPIASTTKIMTALITLCQEDTESYFEVDKNAIMVEGTSMGLKEGDKASLYSLACGMLMSSGNDAAQTAAVKISGSIQKFAELMNKKAKEIGMNNTNFENPSGLHSDNHYSTAYDMALLAREALSNISFAEICSQSKIKTSYGNPPFDRYLTNHNKLIKTYEGCIGVKTGFTKKAGRCLVSAAKRDGVTLICVTLNDPNDWRDHESLFNAGFEKIRKYPIEYSVDALTANIVGGDKKSISVKLSDTAYICTNDENDAKKVETKVCLERFYYSPITKDDVLGEVHFILNGKTIAVTKLLANEDVHSVKIQKKIGFFEKIKNLFIH